MDTTISSHGRESPPHPRPQWALLPTELLAIISQKIADIADFAGFRSVCTSWRSVAKPQDLPPQLPWLLLPYDPKSSSRSFYSFSTESIITLDLPETRDRFICGSSNGWFVTLDDTLSVSLFNPLTRSLVRLPPITTLPEGFERVVRDDCLSQVRCGPRSVITLQWLDLSLNCYALIPPNPINGDGDGVVVLMFEDVLMFEEPVEARYWRPGDAAWTSVELGTDIEAITFYKGGLFVVYRDGRTATCELGPQAKAAIVPSLEIDGGRRYLTTSPVEGELLLVTRNYFYLDKARFQYHKLEEKEGVMIWSEIRGVGDCMVFMGMSNKMPVVCRASGYKRNFVYYVDQKITIRGLIPQLSGVKATKVTLIDDFGAETCHGPWETPHPDAQSPCWIIPSLY